MPEKYTNVDTLLESIHKYTGLMLLIIGGGKQANKSHKQQQQKNLKQNEMRIFNLLSSEPSLKVD